MLIQYHVMKLDRCSLFSGRVFGVRAPLMFSGSGEHFQLMVTGVHPVLIYEYILFHCDVCPFGVYRVSSLGQQLLCVPINRTHVVPSLMGHLVQKVRDKQVP